MRACHHVAIVVWGIVRGVPSIISLPSPVKAAFLSLMTVLFLNLNLYKAPLKENDNELKHPKGGIKLVYVDAITLWRSLDGSFWSNTNGPFWWAMKGQKFNKHIEGKRVVFRTVQTHVDRARAVCWNENSLGSGEQSGRNLQPSIFTSSKFFCFFLIFILLIAASCMFIYSLHNDHVLRFTFSQSSLAHSTAHASRSFGSVAVCLNANSLGSGEQSGRNLPPSIFTNSKFFIKKKICWSLQVVCLFTLFTTTTCSALFLVS